jgi:3-hydroxypropanoate dehydrogenase
MTSTLDPVQTVDPTRLGRLSAEARSIMFTDARTANTFSDVPVTKEELTDIWELSKWAPTSANVQPMRVAYVLSPEGRARLVTHMLDMNKAKTATAPAVAILAMDTEFHEYLPRLVPFRPEMKDRFADDAMRLQSARFNATIQAGYFILAVRAAGLAAGPMLGFDGAGIDAEFFAGTPLRSLLVVNIGHPGENAWFDRLPRLENDEVITWA